MQNDSQQLGRLCAHRMYAHPCLPVRDQAPAPPLHATASCTQALLLVHPTLAPAAVELGAAVQRRECASG